MEFELLGDWNGVSLKGEWLRNISDTELKEFPEIGFQKTYLPISSLRQFCVGLLLCSLFQETGRPKREEKINNKNLPDEQA